MTWPKTSLSQNQMMQGPELLRAFFRTYDLVCWSDFVGAYNAWGPIPWGSSEGDAGTPQDGHPCINLRSVNGYDPGSALTVGPIPNFNNFHRLDIRTAFADNIAILTAAADILPRLNPMCLANVWGISTLPANVTWFINGFLSDPEVATPNGAYVRVVGNANYFFVTRQGGAETVTDLGIANTYGYKPFLIQTLDGGTSWQCYTSTGLAASHNTNVPTKTVGLRAGVSHAMSVTGSYADVASFWALQLRDTP